MDKLIKVTVTMKQSQFEGFIQKNGITRYIYDNGNYEIDISQATKEAIAQVENKDASSTLIDVKEEKKNEGGDSLF